MENHSIALRAILLASLSAHLMYGCAPAHLALHPEDSGPVGTGIVRQKFVEPYEIEVTVDGKTYAGSWRSQKAPDHPLAKSFLHNRHVGRVVATLASRDGKHLYCDWLINSLKGAGTCEDDGHRRFDVTIN